MLLRLPSGAELSVEGHDADEVRENFLAAHRTLNALPRAHGDERVDFLIIAPLQEELAPLQKMLSGCKPAPPAADDAHVYYVGRPARMKYRVALTGLRKMGQKEAAVTTAAAIRRWRPAYVLLVGIAGGSAELGVQLGDVVIATQVIDYELQKLRPSGPEVRYDGFQVDQDLLGAVQSLGKRWWSSISRLRPENGSPGLHFGPMLSGDKVIATREGIRRYRAAWPRCVGLEMEAIGVANAVASLPAVMRPAFFMIRGVSDLADAEKDTKRVKRWREYACNVAAACTVALLKRSPVNLGPQAR